MRVVVVLTDVEVQLLSRTIRECPQDLLDESFCPRLWALFDKLMAAVKAAHERDEIHE